MEEMLYSSTLTCSVNEYDRVLLLWFVVWGEFFHIHLVLEDMADWSGDVLSSYVKV